MPIFDTDDGVIVQQEGQNTRAMSGSLNFLFVNSERNKVIATYKYFVSSARNYFKPRWQSFRGSNLALEDFNEFTKEATLWWMYFYIINRLPVEIKEKDWEHPQTKSIILKAVQRNFQKDSCEASQLCAHLMGLSENEYVNWRKGWELCINR